MSPVDASVPDVPPLVPGGFAGRVRAGFTTRAGGSAEGADGPWAGLNLGDHVGDDPVRVAAHRDALRRAVGGVHLVVPRQVHGAGVAVLDGVPGSAPEADALVTTCAGLALAVVVADCVPVLLADPAAGVVGVVHAGRPGLVAGVVPAAVAAVRSLGGTSVTAVLGPSVCGGCYEVPAGMADDVAARVPAARATTRRGTPAVDVAAGVAAQLEELGVATSRVGGCTAEDPGLYSYRRDGVTGRAAGVVVLV